MLLCWLNYPLLCIYNHIGKNNGTPGPISLKDFSVHVAAMHRGKNHGFEIEYEVRMFTCVCMHMCLAGYLE